MKRFELVYGPKEFDKFESQYDCVYDMVNRLQTIADQEGCEALRTLVFRHKEPEIRAVCIVRESA